MKAKVMSFPVMNTLHHGILSVGNLIIFLSSIGLTCLGIYGITVNAPFIGFFHVSSAGIVLIFGIVLFLLSCIGIYASQSRNSALLKIYFFLVTLLIIFQIVIGTITLARAMDAENIAYDNWRRCRDHDPELLKRMENWFHCCGFSNIKDQPVPSNCTEDPAFGFNESCRFKIESRIESLLVCMGRGTLLFALIETVALILQIICFAEANSGRLRGSASLYREGELPFQSAQPRSN